jgi:hypothetical protein
MTRNRVLRSLTILVVSLAFIGAAVAAKKKHSHHDGKALLGEKLKTNGTHQIHKNGEYTVHAEVKDGKIAKMHVKHSKKGDIAVKKYKTNKKMASLDTSSDEQPAQGGTVIGTTYIGYAYVDDLGNEEIYWVPADIVLDDSGAIEYVPIT